MSQPMCPGASPWWNLHTALDWLVWSYGKVGMYRQYRDDEDLMSCIVIWTPEIAVVFKCMGKWRIFCSTESTDEETCLLEVRPEGSPAVLEVAHGSMLFPEHLLYLIGCKFKNVTLHCTVLTTACRDAPELPSNTSTKFYTMASTGLATVALSSTFCTSTGSWMLGVCDVPGHFHDSQHCANLGIFQQRPVTGGTQEKQNVKAGRLGRSVDG